MSPTEARPAAGPDFPTNADRVCANVIAQALMDRYGSVRLSVRYGAARTAMDMASADAERIAEGDRAWLAANPTAEEPA